MEPKIIDIETLQEKRKTFKNIEQNQLKYDHAKNNIYN